MRKRLAHLDTIDIISIIFFFLLTAALLAYSRSIDSWLVFSGLNAVIIAAIFLLAQYSSARSRIWRLMHGFYMTLCIPIAFKQMYYLVPAINPFDKDAILITIDHWIFGLHPTQWLHQFSVPILTELLQISYASFYLLWIILGVDLFLKKDMRAFKLVFLTIITGFYLSYIGYAAVPAIGPRFTLHDFASTNSELPGLFLTEYLREYVNTGESIPAGTENPERHVQRDCFPSGHTQMTLLVMLLAFRHRSRMRWFLGVNGSLLVIATVYLRYHYVIDLLAGAVFAAMTLLLVKPADIYWSRFRERARNSAGGIPF